jgi:alkyl hydroperoxide reductase subunit AhpF
MNAFNIKVLYEKIVGVKKEGELFKEETEGNAYWSKTVIIASGKKPRSLNVPGEDKLIGKGVTYCVICDTPFFKNKPVAVVGGGNSALQAILELAKFTNQIYVINLTSELTGDEILQESVKKLPFVKVFNNSKVIAIKGERKVESVEFMNMITKEVSSLEVRGVVVEIGLEPSIGFELPKELVLNEKNEIDVDQNCNTSIPGLFAAGDVTDVRWKQIIIAAGEGAKAALSAYDYLINKKDY